MSFRALRPLAVIAAVVVAVVLTATLAPPLVVRILQLVLMSFGGLVVVGLISIVLIAVLGGLAGLVRHLAGHRRRH